ncbi:hypothetical protein ACFC96_31835 [Streptomyces sp. NPDC055955]|uniref:hypothetical protein n=1 Tax=Streptomyces sp. NPDC055955 TaxID=3345665 RepID=UPI0035DF624B
MVFTIAQRAAVGAASVTFAAAGLLTSAGPASAATHPANDRTAVASQHVPLPGTHDDGRNQDAARDSNDDARRRWVSDQITWALHHNHADHPMNTDDSLRRWVNDQITWALHHNHADHPMNNDDSLRRWVNDQITWTLHHNGPHHWTPQHEEPSLH